MAWKPSVDFGSTNTRATALIVAVAMAGLAIASVDLGPDRTDVTGAIVLTILLLLGAFILAMGRITVFRIALLVGIVFFAFSSFEDTRTLNQEVRAIFRFVVNG